MANAAVACNPFEFVGLKNIGHQSHPAMGGQRTILATHNACAFLATMLKRIQTKVNQFRCFGMSVNAKYATLLPGMIIINST